MKSLMYWILATIAFSLLQVAAMAQDTEPTPEPLTYPSYKCKVKQGPSRGKSFVIYQSEDPKVYGHNLPIGTVSVTVPNYEDLPFKKAGFDTVLTYGNGLKFAHPSNPDIYSVLIYKGKPGPKKFKAEFVLVDNKAILAYKIKCKRIK